MDQDIEVGGPIFTHSVTQIHTQGRTADPEHRYMHGHRGHTRGHGHGLATGSPHRHRKDLNAERTDTQRGTRAHRHTQGVTTHVHMGAHTHTHKETPQRCQRDHRETDRWPDAMDRAFSAHLCLDLKKPQLPLIHTGPQRPLGHHPELRPKTFSPTP